MRDALKRAYAAKLAAEQAATIKAAAPAPAPAPAPAKAITPPKPEKHWGSRDYPHPVRAAAKAAPVAKFRHVVSIPGRASYDQ